jgi:hypothetical protein
MLFLPQCEMNAMVKGFTETLGTGKIEVLGDFWGR